MSDVASAYWAAPPVARFVILVIFIIESSTNLTPIGRWPRLYLYPLSLSIPA